jgi:AAA family ATP:ADP antiporter
MGPTTVVAPAPTGAASRLLQRLVAVRPEEVRAVSWCWLYIFAVLSSYYIMRPIRDQMGIAGGVKNLPWLFLGTLAGMVLLNLPFAYLVKKLPRSRFIPLTYRFFAANILLFAVALHVAGTEQTIWVGRIFFIWVSVYNLFVVSVFWQLNVDLFSPEQGKRLFGFIAAGATLGALFGSSITATLALYVSPTFLLIGAALLLEVAVFAVSRLAKLSPSLHQMQSETVQNERQKGDERPVGGSVFAGMLHALGSPYLLSVGAFLLLYSMTSTFAYFQQQDIVSLSIKERGAQTAFLATIDVGVNSLALLVQLFLTGRVVAVLGLFQVIRRATDYAITRPVREVIYTVVSREDRYKAKGFIDTFVYRAGDQVGAWSAPLLMGMSLWAAPLAAIAIAALWLVNALWLGRRQQALEAAGPHG